MSIREIAVPTAAPFGGEVSPQLTVDPSGAVYWSTFGFGETGFKAGRFTFTYPGNVQGFGAGTSAGPELSTVNAGGTVVWTTMYQSVFGQMEADIMQLGAGPETATPAGIATPWTGTNVFGTLSGPNSQVYADFARGANGSLWIAGGASDGSSILNIFLNFREYSHGTQDFPYDAFSNFALAQDGTMWASGFACKSYIYRYVTGCSGEIVSFDPTGNIVNRYPVSTDAIGGLTFDGQGTIWFTDQGNNSIGEMKSGKVVANVPIPTANATPQRIVFGPDGALWFTEATGNKIGRLQEGAISEYALKTPSAAPYGIVASPLKKMGRATLWFTELGHIGKISLTY